MLQDLSLLATKADTVQERVVDDLCEDCRHKPHKVLSGMFVTIVLTCLEVL
jgi:hypothetical protein